MTPEEEQEQLRLQMEMEAEAEREAEGSHEEKASDVDGAKRVEVHATPRAEPADDEKEKTPGLLERAGHAVAEFLRPESSTGALASGISKGATLGFGDELYGALAGTADKAEHDQAAADAVETAKQEGRFGPEEPEKTTTSYTLKRPGMSDVQKTAPAHTASETENPDALAWSDAYRQARESMRQQYATAEKEHPYLEGLGELAGSFAIPLPGPGKAKGLAKVGKYALQGAGIGAASGLGNSDADITKADVGDAFLDTAKGALGGAAVGTALGGVASKVDPWLEKAAARRAYKALDPYMSTLSEGLGEKVASGQAPVSEAFSEMERLGRRALDEDIIPRGPLARFADTEGINERAVSKLNDTGVLKGAFVDHAADELSKLGQNTPVSLGRLATQLEQEASEAKVNGNQKLARRLLSEAREVRQTVVDRASAGFKDPAAQTLQEAERFKTGKQGEVDYGRPLASREAQTAVARLAKEQAEKAIESGLGPEELEQFKALKDRYGDLSTLAKTSGHGAIRSFRNQSVGLGDKIAASAGAHAAAPGLPAAATAIVSGLGHHAVNHRGSAGLARTLMNASERTSPWLAPAAEQTEEAWRKLRGEEEP